MISFDDARALGRSFLDGRQLDIARACFGGPECLLLFIVGVGR